MDRTKEFLSTISHEIRTPLTSIRGFSKTILDSFDNLNDEQKKKFIKIIYEQSQRLITLIENALTAASADKKADDSVFKKADINKILLKSIDVVKINYKNIQYKPDLKGELFSFADTDKLQQIFVNILDNASKYSKNSDIVEIKTACAGGRNYIYIKNYGVSIDDKNKSKIFEKFYRIEGYLTSQTQGSGLGLYIVKMLVDLMKGDIRVNSSKNPDFTEFVISFPVFSANDYKMSKEA